VSTIRKTIHVHGFSLWIEKRAWVWVCECVCVCVCVRARARACLGIVYVDLRLHVKMFFTQILWVTYWPVKLWIG